nr:cytochrome P450 [uncultured Sphingomonas sp.]
MSPEGIAALQPRVAELARRLLDDMIAKSLIVDLHDDFALPLPVHVISWLLGIQGDDFITLKHWSDELMDNAFGKSNERFLEVYAGICAFFDQHLDARYAMLTAAGVEEARPEHVGTVLPDDWISDAVCADYLGRKLNRDEQRMALMGLLVGGNETTTSLITNLMWRLLEEPSRWEQVRSDPDQFIPVAIEESLRFDSPAQAMFRTTLCPVEVAGVEIGPKQKLMLNFAAANRDPAAFDDPDSFRLDRDARDLSRRHLAFGGGPHGCPGAPLSRMEVAVVMRLFVEHLPAATLAGPSERSVGYNMRGRSQTADQSRLLNVVAQERADVVAEQDGLLQCGKMPAARHLGPRLDVVDAFGIGARGHRIEFTGEQGGARRYRETPFKRPLPHDRAIGPE